VEVLVTLRILQGIGGAMIVSTSPGTVTSVFPAAQRGKILGLQAGLVEIALSIGPTLAGVLIGMFGRVGIAGGIHGTMRHLGNLAGITIVGSYFSARRASIMESQALAGPAKEIATSSFLGALHETFFLSFPSHCHYCLGHIPIAKIP